MEKEREIIDRITQDMRQAMKSGERLKAQELKSLLARIHNAEAVAPQAEAPTGSGPIAGASEGVGSTEMPRKTLSLGEIQAVIREELQEIESALTGLDTENAYAGELQAKVAVVNKYL